MTRNPHAAEPFTDDDQVIAAALQDVSVPALLCSLVHMTGDPAWVRGDVRPRVAVSLDIQSGIPPDEQAQVLRLALPTIRAYRDGGCQPKELPLELLQEMMSFLAAALWRVVLRASSSTTCSSRVLIRVRSPGATKSQRTSGRRLRSSSSVAVWPGFWLAFALHKQAYRSSSLTKIPVPGERGGRTATRERGSMLAAISTVTPSSRPIIGVSSIVSNPNCSSISPPLSRNTICGRTASSTLPSPSCVGMTSMLGGVFTSAGPTGQRRSSTPDLWSAPSGP